MEMKKETYEGIVKFTLESMLELSKKDKYYNLQLDTLHYFENKIIPDGQLTKKEFLAICKEVGI